MPTNFTLGDLNQWQSNVYSGGQQKRALDGALRAADTVCIIQRIDGDTLIWRPADRQFPALETTSSNKRQRSVTDAEGSAVVEIDDIPSHLRAGSAVAAPSPSPRPMGLGDAPTASKFFLAGKFAIGQVDLEVEVDFTRVEPVFEVPIKTLLLKDVIDFMGDIVGIAQFSTQMPCPIENALPMTMEQLSVVPNPSLVINYGLSSVTMNINNTVPVVNGDATLLSLSFSCATDGERVFFYHAELAGLPIADSYPFQELECSIRRPRPPEEPRPPFDGIVDFLKRLLLVAAGASLFELARYGRPMFGDPMSPDDASDLIKAMKKALDETGRAGTSLASCAEAVFAETALAFAGCVAAGVAAGLSITDWVATAIAVRRQTPPQEAVQQTYDRLPTKSPEEWNALLSGLVRGYGWTIDNIGDFARAIAVIQLGSIYAGRSARVDIGMMLMVRSLHNEFPAADYVTLVKALLNGTLPLPASVSAQARGDWLYSMTQELSRLFGYPYQEPGEVAHMLTQPGVWPGITAQQCWLATYGAGVDNQATSRLFAEGACRAAVAALGLYSRADLDRCFPHMMGIKFAPDVKVAIANPTRLRWLQSFSVGAWIKAASAVETQDIFSQGLDVTGHTVVRIAEGQYQVGNYYPSGTTPTFLAKCAIPAGDIGYWNRLIVTCDGATWSIYSNGTLLGSAPYSAGLLQNPNAEWLIGGTGSLYFRGFVRSLQVYNVALTADEVRADMLFPATRGMIGGYFPWSGGSAPSELAITNQRWEDCGPPPPV